MADMSDRAQLIVTGALAIAVAFVVLGLVLNLVIFTENLATRDTNQEARDISYQDKDAVHAVSRAIRYVNVNENTNLTELTIGFGREIHLLGGLQERHGALGGTVTSVTPVSENPGTRIVHNNGSRSFTNDDGDSTWVVLQGIDPWTTVGGSQQTHNPAYFEQNISRGNLTEIGPGSTSLDLLLLGYHIEVVETNTTTGSTRRWRVFIVRDAITNAAMLITEDPTEDFGTSPLNFTQMVTRSCMVDDPEPTLDLIDGSFGGRDSGNCKNETDFYPDGTEDLTNPHIRKNADIEVDVEFNNTDELLGQAKGEYEILIDESTTNADDNYFDPGNGNPFTHSALFSAVVRVTNENREMTYEVDQVAIASTFNTQRFPGFPPELDECEVTDTSGGGEAEYQVNWNVSDVDQNLDRVELVLTDETEDTIKDQVTETASGGSQTGSTTLVDTDRDLVGDDYTVRMTVVDMAGNARSESHRDASDGDGTPIDPCA